MEFMDGLSDEEVFACIKNDLETIETDFQLGKVELFGFRCHSCDKYARVEGYEVPKYCPNCGHSLENDYDVDGHFVYRTLRLHNEEEI